MWAIINKQLYHHTFTFAELVSSCFKRPEFNSRCNSIQLKYCYEGYSAPLEINMGKGQWKQPVSRNNHTLTVLLYRYNTFMPAYLHLLSFFMNMRISNVTLLCQDYAMVRRLPLKNFVVS